MTVCVATMCAFDYARAGQPSDPGYGAIVASDRMITAFDVEYEPPQLKVASITQRIILLIAGDYSLHSQAIRETVEQIRRDQNALPHNVAAIYGSNIQKIKQRQAEGLYLAPFGLNTDTFLAQQKDMANGFIDTITSQMQGYQGDEVEALVVGSDGRNAHIYGVDPRGTVSCFDDVGFAAIGIGAWHSKSFLMQLRYSNSSTYTPALAATFAAKKRGEVAPGVGSATDIHLVFRDHVEQLYPQTLNKMEQLFKEYESGREELAAKVVNDLREFLSQQVNQQKVDDDKERELAGGGAKVDGGAASEAPKTARENEGGEGSVG